MIEAAREALEKGNREEARELLEQLLENDEYNADAWFLMYQAVDTDEERRICLDNVLAIDGEHAGARAALQLLEQSDEEDIFGDFDPFADEAIGEAEAVAPGADLFFEDDVEAEPARRGARASRIERLAGNRGLLIGLMALFAIGTILLIVVAILLLAG
ncbi:MAG: hypothetical protein Kow00120_02120 [Anaerolineae bacterium]